MRRYDDNREQRKLFETPKLNSKVLTGTRAMNVIRCEGSTKDSTISMQKGIFSIMVLQGLLLLRPIIMFTQKLTTKPSISPLYLS